MSPSSPVQPPLLLPDALEPAATPRRAAGSRIIVGDAREVLRCLPEESVKTCVTSPPYWSLRDYAVTDQIGAEHDVDDYVASICQVCEEVRRVLATDGSLWINIGDCYTSGGRTWRAPDRKNNGRAMSYRPPTPAGLKPKDLVGVPWRVAFALQERGWYLRSDVIWHKPNCQPESVRDRPTQAHEYLFFLTRSADYYYDYEAAREVRDDGRGFRNRRSVWTVNTVPFPKAHFAAFPPELIAPCILAGSAPGDTVLDPFFGTGTTGFVARECGREFIGIELNREYAEMAAARIGWSADALETCGGEPWRT